MVDKTKRTPRPKRAKQGDFIRIPINETHWSYGRVTADETVAFYDILTDHDLEMEQLRHQAIVFRAHVMRYALNGKEWPVVGNLPLEEELQKPAEFRSTFCSPEDKEYYATTDGTTQYPITYERAKQLEILSFYEPPHVVERLALHFEGKPDPYTEMFRLD